MVVMVVVLEAQERINAMHPAKAPDKMIRLTAFLIIATPVEKSGKVPVFIRNHSSDSVVQFC